MNYNYIIPAFAARLNKISNDKNFRKDKAFVDWYLRTKFDVRRCSINLTDGSSDGEIDGIVFEGDITYIIQSKFSEKILKGYNATVLPIGEYAKFDKTISAFENKENFNEYIKTIDASLRDLYTQTFKRCQKNPDLVVWEMTTLYKPSPSGERRVENKDKINYHYYDYNIRLCELSLEGATPLAKPIELNFTENPLITDDHHTRIKSYIAQVFLRDFIDYTDDDPYFTIISRNVRNDLRSEINDQIRHTYLHHPEEFWYSHNGMTIICEQATIKGKKFLLVGPNIINGAQTIHSVKGLDKRDPKACILVKIIEIAPEARISTKFINNIILRTNQQNKIYTYDLKANDPLQVKLATQFLEHRIFYDRRRGDWDINKRIYRNEGLERLQSRELAQILVTCRIDLGGVLTAKGSIEELFTDKYFYRIFEGDFDVILFKYFLFYLVSDSILNIKTQKQSRRERNIVVFNCFAIVWDALESCRDISDWCIANKLDTSKLIYGNNKTKNFQYVMKELFRECWNKYLSEIKRQETLRPTDFFSKSRKWNKYFIKKYVPKYRNKMIKSIQKILE